MSERASKDTILNIPVPTSSANRSSMATPTSSRATPTAPGSEASEDPDPSEADECEDGIGEFDDGRSGKVTLGVLIQDGIIELFVANGKRYGKTFDLVCKLLTRQKHHRCQQKIEKYCTDVFGFLAKYSLI